jgi:cytochrome c556
MKKIIIISALACLISAGSVVAQEAKSEKQANNAVKFRQSIFQLVRSNMGPLGGMAKGQIPFNEQTMEVNGQRIEQLGLMIEDYFALDTTPIDVKTGAKDSIWKNRDDFNSKAMDMVKAAQALQLVAKSKDESNYRKAIGAVGATCKACHDDYKKD